LKQALNIVGITEIVEPIILKTAQEVMERDFCYIESFNDHPLTRHADVIAVLHRAQAKLVVANAAASWVVTRSTHTKAQWFRVFWRKIFRQRRIY
jgi:hypothetical protein